MLLRRQSAGGPAWYESPLLAAAGIPHAFTTRVGGVSLPPFDSLNFGNPAGTVQDSQENLNENYRRIQSAIGVADRTVLRVHQMHGCTIALAAPNQPFNIHAQADAVIVTDPNQLASVRIADCAPVLLAAKNGRGVAAVHAGWRGVVAGIVPRAVEQLRALFPNENLIAAIGPCIGPAAFEVGPEVLEIFQSQFGAQAPIARSANDKGRVDLRAAIQLQLQKIGIPPERIDLTDRCTFTHSEEFFSHRRDHGITGRMVALIGPRKKIMNYEL